MGVCHADSTAASGTSSFTIAEPILLDGGDETVYTIQGDSGYLSYASDIGAGVIIATTSTGAAQLFNIECNTCYEGITNFCRFLVAGSTTTGVLGTTVGDDLALGTVSACAEGSICQWDLLAP
ncbi:hypothetical protein MNV49_004528 [Pseudohyphozyma bogoriensis]|nr:hypothetical protein MNV49_004528 [Pseudohyphozyma bogoriensis]